MSRKKTVVSTSQAGLRGRKKLKPPPVRVTAKLTRSVVPFDFRRVFQPESTSKVAHRSRIASDKDQRLQEEDLAEALREGATLVDVQPRTRLGDQVTKDGFLGRGGKGDRFHGTEKTKGMVFYPLDAG